MRTYLYASFLSLGFFYSAACEESIAPEQRDIQGKFINLLSYLKWDAEVPFEDRQYPDRIKSRKDIGIYNLGGTKITPNSFFPFLRYITEKAISEGKSKEVALEMAGWIRSEHVMRRISAQTVLEMIFPEEENRIDTNPVEMTKEQRNRIAEKFERIAALMK